MKYDAIVVLGAVMDWNPTLEMWTFPDIVPSYAGKLVLGYRRAQAAMLIHNKAPVILVTGGSDTHPETGKKCSRAVELAMLIMQMGVPSDKVEVIGRNGSSHTLGNVENVVEYLRANSRVETVAILSPLFQYHRARMMFDANPYFKKSGRTLHWLIVETILMKKNQISLTCSKNSIPVLTHLCVRRWKYKVSRH